MIIKLRRVRKIWVLILALLPISIMAQQLECCKTVTAVETYLAGNWKKKDRDLNKIYQFEFKEAGGAFRIFKIDEGGALAIIKNSETVLRILKTEKGYRLEHDRGGLKTYDGVQYLDTTTLILTRRDGKASVFYKVVE